MNELLILAAIVVAIGGGYSLIRVIAGVFRLAYEIVAGLFAIIRALGGKHDRRRNPARDGRPGN